jgi:hypothetical protein
MSRSAVSVEHFVSFAYIDVFKTPLKSPKSRLMTRRCRSLTGWRLRPCQTRALRSADANDASALSMARPYPIFGEICPCALVHGNLLTYLSQPAAS